jgi:PAS domain-containing protein
LVQWKQEVMATGQPQRREARTSLATGARFYDLFILPRRNAAGEIVGVAGTALDITERKLAEAALRESEVRLRTMAESLPNLVWTDLPDGQCDWLSSQWAQYTGIPVEELLGLNWLDRVLHPDDREHRLLARRLRGPRQL